MYDILTIFAGFVFLFSAISGGLARTPISGPIVYCVFGWLIEQDRHADPVVRTTLDAAPGTPTESPASRARVDVVERGGPIVQVGR